MEIFSYLFIAGFFAVASPSDWVSPSISNDLLPNQTSDLFCRDSTEEETIDGSTANYGKASAFNLRGFYRCERKLFEYGDRNSFIDLVAESVPSQADFAARKFKDFIKSNRTFNESNHKILAIEVISEVDVLTPLVENAFQTVFAQRVTDFKILRRPTSEIRPHHRLRVYVRRIDDPSAIIQTRLLWERNGIVTEVKI